MVRAHHEHIAEGRRPLTAFDVLLDDERAQIDAFVEDYRQALPATLTGLSEGQARARLVPSDTTLLGLIKHVTWMQRVWFEECVGGTTRADLGLVSSPAESFLLDDEDSIHSVVSEYERVCDAARSAVATRSLDDVVSGHSAGPRTLRWVYLQVLRELAHHCGHADILREQILSDPTEAIP
jgi:hypothetical protein